MIDRGPVVALVASSAGGVETVREGFVGPARARGWTVAVTLTPTAARWLSSAGEDARLAEATGLPVRVDGRLPGEASPHPPASCYVVAPASANTVAKIALGIADNQAVSTVVEAIGLGDVPVVVFPRVNAAHTRHPAWAAHTATLRSVGVHLVEGDDVWRLHEPRAAPPGRRLPWAHILDLIDRLAVGR